jgi:predicted enzyme related to lactoylglutathione lyase
MAEESATLVGKIGWIDLTVENAEEVRDFYSEVAGWTPAPVEMEGYQDFTMCTPEDGAPVGGVCHARGPNADLPPQWIIYINVEDLERSMSRCKALGGRILQDPRTMGEYGVWCVIQDPAGAVAALFQPAA